MAAEHLGHPLHKVTRGRRVTRGSKAQPPPGGVAANPAASRGCATRFCPCGRAGSIRGASRREQSLSKGGRCLLASRLRVVSAPRGLCAVEWMGHQHPPSRGIRGHPCSMHVRGVAPSGRDPAHHRARPLQCLCLRLQPAVLQHQLLQHHRLAEHVEQLLRDLLGLAGEKGFLGTRPPPARPAPRRWHSPA